MDTTEYRRLCARLDDVLLAAPITEDRLAISRLHMIRNHPVYTEGYASLLVNRSGGGFLRHVAERLKRVVILAIHLVRVAVNRATAHRQLLPATECDAVIVSYLFSHAKAADDDDVYFGRVAAGLQARGRSALVLRFDSTPGIRNTSGPTPAGHVTLDRFLPMIREVRMAARMWRQSRVLSRQARATTDQRLRRLLMFASNDALTMWSISNLRRIELVADVIARVHPKALVTTYEGLPWERMLYARARTIVPDLRCVGYQQAPIFRGQHSIARPLGPQFDPDVILASSEYSQRQLQSVSDYPAATFDVLGSNRGGTVACLRPLTDIGAVGILVVPEGIVDECVRMFRFVKEAAAAMPDCTFTFRLHPNMSFARLRRAAPAVFTGVPANVTLSTSNLASDIDRSHVALYRGSSAIVGCINGGLRPVYLSLGGSDEVDPLYDLSDLVPRVSHCDQLVVLVRAARLSSEFRHIAEIRAFAAQYYSPLSPDRLAAHIPTSHPHAHH